MTDTIKFEGLRKGQWITVFQDQPSLTLAWTGQVTDKTHDSITILNDVGEDFVFDDGDDIEFFLLKDAPPAEFRVKADALERLQNAETDGHNNMPPNARTTSVNSEWLDTYRAAVAGLLKSVEQVDD